MLMDCVKALRECKGSALEDSMDKLVRFELYHLLFKPSMTTAMHAAERFAFAPEDYLKWIRFCAGGDLQVCEFLGETGVDKDTGVRYGTFDEYEKEAKKAGLPAEYHVFAVANFGDYFCFRSPADGSRDACVHQWGLHEGEEVLYWDSFADWLSEQVTNWVEMIADDELDPIGLKVEDAHE